MEQIISNKIIDYDGSQLRSSWIMDTFNLPGDAIAAFTGKCDVKPEYMVDLEDLNAGASIYSGEMLHFIVEHPNINLKETVFRQRILVCLIKEVLEGLIPEIKIIRTGDDLFERDYKLTVSIATTSPVSGLIHTGINISSKNTPVKTKGLKDYNIEPRMFAGLVLKKYREEIISIDKCLTKVKRVD